MPPVRLLALAAAACAALPAQAIAPPPPMPKALHGVWMIDNPAGRSQCTQYKAALKKNPSEAGNRLVGSEVIHRFGQHSYAEYGEGNFYTARVVTALGKGTWRVAARLGMEGPPDPTEPAASAVIHYALIGGKLVWKLEELNGKRVGSRPARRYFRCADVPRGRAYPT